MKDKVADYEQVIARGVLQALQAAKMKRDDVQLLKASFMSKPDPEIAPRDSHRANTFASIQKLRDGIAASEPQSALNDLLSAAEASANAWLQARS